VTTWTPGELAPAPGAAPVGRMLRAQSSAELKLVLRTRGERADFFVPGLMALAVMSAAFTGQAIAVGFERQYGVLKRLGATALPRWVLLLAKTLSVLVVELLQLTLLAAVGLALGWSPRGAVVGAVVLVALGTAAFAGLGLLLGGTLRGLTSLAAANLVWLVLLVLGGIVFPLSAFGPAEGPLSLLPTAALSGGLREVLEAGAVLPLRETVVLAAWAVGGLALAARLFRWE
jgi:ABC-2 type transport system permease protein